MRCCAIARDVVACRAAISVCVGTGSSCRRHGSYVPPRHLRAVRQAGQAAGTWLWAGPARGNLALGVVLSVAGRDIVGGDKRQRRQQALLLLRVIPRHAREPDVVSYSAASGACRSVSSTSRPYIACERSSVLPSCRLCPPTGLPSHGGADFEE